MILFYRLSKRDSRWRPSRREEQSRRDEQRRRDEQSRRLKRCWHWSKDEEKMKDLRGL